MVVTSENKLVDSLNPAARKVKFSVVQIPLTVPIIVIVPELFVPPEIFKSNLTATPEGCRSKDIEVLTLS